MTRVVWSPERGWHDGPKGTLKTDERNRLVLSGAYERVFVCELRPGDVTAVGEVVESVERVTDERTFVTMTNGHLSVYGHGQSTTLIEARP